MYFIQTCRFTKFRNSLCTTETSELIFFLFCVTRFTQYLLNVQEEVVWKPLLWWMEQLLGIQNLFLHGCFREIYISHLLFPRIVSSQLAGFLLHTCLHFFQSSACMQQRVKRGNTEKGLGRKDHFPVLMMLLWPCRVWTLKSCSRNCLGVLCSEKNQHLCWHRYIEIYKHEASTIQKHFCLHCSFKNVQYS